MICFKRHKITTMGRDFGQAPLFILNFLIFLSVSSEKEYKKVLKKDIHQGVKDTIKKWTSQL